ncbi:alkene reductase [Pleomorphomonas oryzae]|uniref:alkene reductase n=1 Tax=Pleomorphomonas oryzae TaxID=261934 RepID=UPI0004195DD5|nr:alkene reductase [Pleomorphomonas oryzae]
MPTLFDPVRLGALELSNRVIMAPLTRARATPDRVPTEVMREYYEQRATAGLILTEATIVTPKGAGYASTPGIYSDAQVEAWKPITEAVHRKGGKIVMQLWHVGRISDPSLLDGDLPVAPSALQPAGHVSLLRPMRPYPTPRALDIEEIPGIVEAFRKGAENAQKAGFDGVELHGANGYLLDQFLQDKTNQRTDAYGGPVENRARLMLEAVDAAISVWGASRVGLHLAPRGDSHDMGDSDPKATFGYVAREAGKRGLAFIFTREHLGDDRLTPYLKEQFGGAFIANEGFTLDLAAAEVAAGRADAVAWGKEFIANPDLVERFRTGAARNPLVPETIYAEGALGYSDYPALETVTA